MEKEIKIRQLLCYLEEKEIKYTFKGNEEDIVKGFSSLFNYKSNTLTFISSMYDYKDFYSKNKDKIIQLIITSSNNIDDYANANNIIQVDNSKIVFFDILEEFYRDSDESEEMIKTNQAHSFISDKAIIGKNVKIGIVCVIEPNVQIGDNTEIHHNVVIRSNSKIGKNCTIYSGTVIGERGFNPQTLEDKTRQMVKHYAGVTIKDNVHIGVNCSIHKGTIDDTVIEDGVKLNTMVHIAHNSVIGSNTVVTMPTQVCGSVNIGKNCHIAAMTIRNQCNIGENATLGLGSVIVKDVEADEVIVGNPGKPLRK